LVPPSWTTTTSPSMIASPGLSRAAATVENRVVQSIPLDDVRFATTISHHRCACWVRGVNGVHPT
jgi:hypothetical protein